LGETGTGKTHLELGWRWLLVGNGNGCGSRRQRMRIRWLRYELIVIDELGYVVMPDTAAELLFQIISGRAERAAVIAKTNTLDKGVS